MHFRVHHSTWGTADKLMCYLLCQLFVNVLVLNGLRALIVLSTTYHALDGSTCVLSAVYYEAWYTGRGLVRRLVPTL